jgi:uncharacterized protein DUF4203
VVPSIDKLPAAALLLLGGVIVCFFGRRMFRVSLAIVGFVIGAGAASSVFGVSDRLPMMIAGIVVGLIGAGILYAAYYVGVALVGAGLGAVVANVAFSMMRTGDPPVLVIVLYAVAGAVAATYLQRYFVIVGSGVVGALLMIHGAIGVAGRQLGISDSSSVWVVYPFDPAPGRRWVTIAWGALSLIGIAVQLGWTGGEKGRIGRRKPKAA